MGTRENSIATWCKRFQIDLWKLRDPRREYRRRADDGRGKEVGEQLRQAAKLTGERGVRGHPHIQGSPSRSGGGIFVIPDQPIESDTGYLAEFT